MVRNFRKSNANKANEKNSSLNSKRKKLRKIIRKANKALLSLISKDEKNIIEGENHFHFESTTRDVTSAYFVEGLSQNNISLSFINGFSEEQINTDDKINNFNIDNYKTNY